MAGFVEVPVNMMGTPLNELQIQAALIRLNDGFHFDWAGKHGMWHPYSEGKQGVYWNGQHLCSMDRGQIPQAPIWSTVREGVRVNRSEMSYAELTDPFSIAEVEFHVDGTESETGWFFLKRTVKDRLLWIGWQAMLRKVCNRNIPGVTAATVGRELGVTLDLLKECEAIEIEENRTHLYDASGRTVTMD